MRHRREGRRWAWAAPAALVAAMVLVACSSNTAAAPTPTHSATVEAPPLRSTTTPTATPRLDAEAAVAHAYERYLAATVAAMETGDPTHPALVAIAREQALAAAQARVASLTAQRRIARGKFTPDIQLLEVDGSSARIRDCYRADIVEFDRQTRKRVADRGGTRFSASAELSRGKRGQWIVVQFVEGDFCVPSELAETIRGQYLAFWNAVAAASRPPNPDHPALEATAAGKQLQGLRARLTEFREKSYEVRGRNISNPLVVRVTTRDTIAFVRDCRQLDPKGGVYDARSGKPCRVVPSPGSARCGRAACSWSVACGRWWTPT